MADGGVPSMWYSIIGSTSNGAYYWYAGTTQIMALVNLAAGTRRLDLTAGTVTNPAISAGLNSSDTNTGIYFPAADTIGFVRGGVEAIRINSSGNVGIGTTTQTALLQLNSAGSATTGAAQLYISGSTLNRIDFATAGVAAPATTTRSAGTKITLYPSVDASNVDYGFGILSGALWYSVPTATSSHWHAFYGGTTERMRIMGDGQIRLGAGTVSLPVISAGLNSTDTNTGIYFPAADTIGFVEGGVEAMRIDSNGRINLLGGTIANPILNAGLNSTDTDTGLYFPAANSLGLVTGGIEIIRLSGNTTSFSGGTVSLPAINAGLNSNDTNTGIYFPAADSIGFSVGANSVGVMNTTGYGIQTASPSAWIHLSSTPSASKWIRFDATRNANLPPEFNGGPPDTGIGTNGAIQKYLQEPDVWMEVILDSAGKGGAVVLIPCYLPA